MWAPGFRYLKLAWCRSKNRRFEDLSRALIPLLQNMVTTRLQPGLKARSNKAVTFVTPNPTLCKHAAFCLFSQDPEFFFLTCFSPPPPSSSRHVHMENAFCTSKGVIPSSQACHFDGWSAHCTQATRTNKIELMTPV